MIYSQRVNNIYLFLKGSEKLSYLIQTHERPLFPLNSIRKCIQPSPFGEKHAHFLLAIIFSHWLHEFQNPHGQVSYYGGRQTIGNIWEPCWKTDPPPPWMPFKINKQRKENERTSLCHRESKWRIMIWRNTLKSRVWGTDMNVCVCLFCSYLVQVRFWYDGLGGKLRSWCEQDPYRD